MSSARRLSIREIFRAYGPPAAPSGRKTFSSSRSKIATWRSCSWSREADASEPSSSTTLRNLWLDGSSVIAASSGPSGSPVQADRGRARVRWQALGLGERDGGGRKAREGVGVALHDRGALEEVVDRKPRGEASGPAGRQHVVGSGHII